MQKVTIKNIVPGAIVTKPIFNEDGVMLVPNGTILHEMGVRRLIEMGIHEAFIVYPESETSRILELYEESPHLDDIIYQRTRVQAKQLIKRAMSRMLPGDQLDMGKISNIVDEIIDQLLSVKEIILTLSRLKTIDDYTYEHCVNVCVISLVIGIDLNLKQPELRHLGVGALLHDVGKAYISGDVLNKPATLTNQEYDQIKSHTEIGYKILIKSGVAEEAAQIALYHHEKYDGTGYNRCLSGDTIPLLSRIVTLADSYDAMSNDRTYRKKLAPDKVYKEIANLSGSQFDCNITDRFLRRIDLFPIGTGIILNTGHKGVVVGHNKFLPQSPVIRIFKGETDSENNRSSANYVDINLAKTKYLFIVDTF